MCGIIFSYSSNEAPSLMASKARRALNALKHRGPDEEGLFSDHQFAIGHRRLSIIDLKHSQQPMTDPLKRFFLSYNGEVYNFNALKKQLSDKWNFTTTGDTEVILAGLICFGDRFIQQMEGMWAFAFWDSVEQKLLLSRDRMGKKPLYYEQTKGTLNCASELPALEKLSDKKWVEDDNSTADYFRFGYYLPGTTAYQKIFEVLPGHNFYWQPDGKACQKGYWSLSLGGFKGSLNDAKNALQTTIDNAVKQRLVADVEVGAFLSGGMDSSLVTSMASHYLGDQLKGFTIGFSDPSFNESNYARIVAQHTGIEHHIKMFDQWDLKKLLRIIFENIGQPFSDSSVLPTAMVSDFASSYLKVVLSGDGGDELFCGYQRYQARAILRWYTRLPKRLRDNVGNIIRLMPEPMAHHSRSIFKKAHLFQDIIDRLDSETPYIAPVMYPKTAFQTLLPDIWEKGHKAPNIPEDCGIDDIQKMMVADSLVYLPQDILLKVDRSTMAHSLEARAPFLDKKVVELAFSLPLEWHRRGLTGKRMLNDTFKYRLPSIIRSRRKQGFSVPIHSWFKSKMGTKLETLVNELKTPLNKPQVNRLLAEHRSGKRDNGHRLWTIYVYLLWKQRRASF